MNLLVKMDKISVSVDIVLKSLMEGSGKLHQGEIRRGMHIPESSSSFCKLYFLERHHICRRLLRLFLGKIITVVENKLNCRKMYVTDQP